MRCHGGRKGGSGRKEREGGTRKEEKSQDRRTLPSRVNTAKANRIHRFGLAQKRNESASPSRERRSSKRIDERNYWSGAGRVGALSWQSKNYRTELGSEKTCETKSLSVLIASPPQDARQIPVGGDRSCKGNVPSTRWVPSQPPEREESASLGRKKARGKTEWRLRGHA